MHDGKKSKSYCPPTTDEVVLAATAISLALAKDKDICELETLINIVTLVKCNLGSILMQKSINKRMGVEVDIVV